MDEWLKWKGGIPSFYQSIADMPFETFRGFEFLCNKYGKMDRMPLGTNSHNALLQKEMERVHNPGAGMENLMRLMGMQ